MKALPSILAAIIAGLIAVAPTLQGMIAHHPALAAVLGAIYAIVSHLLPSPVLSGQEKPR